MRRITIPRQLDTADPNGICLDQTTGGAGNLLINGALASGGIATLDIQRRVTLESAANLSAITFTITGTDQEGKPVTEAIAGPNATTTTTTKDFLTITQIAVSAAVGTNVEIGTSAVGGSQIIPLDQYLTPFNVSLRVEVVGTVNYTVQYTFNDVFDPDSDPTDFIWQDHVDLTALAVTAEATFISPVTAARILTNSGIGTATLYVLQAGVQ